MKLVILAGGLRLRISKGIHLKPKPMIEIGGCLTSPSSLFRLSAPPVVNEVLAVGIQA